MKITPKLAALFAVLFLPVVASAESGIYVAGGVGTARLSEAFDGFDVDTDSTAWRLNVGWRFNDYFALEGGYHNFGQFEQTLDDNGTPLVLSLKADGFTLGGVGSVPLSERFSLFGRAGAYFWDGDALLNDVSSAAPEETNLYLGAGVRFALGQSFAVSLDATRYDLDGSDSTVVSFGLDYQF